MANRFFGLNRSVNANPDDVVVGTVTGSTDIELRIDDTKGITTLEVEALTEALVRRVMDGRSNLISQV
jgi:hypothetical protein